MATTTRDRVLSDPRSGARPLGNSDPGPGTRTIEPTRVSSPARTSSRGTLPPAGRAPERTYKVSTGGNKTRSVPNLGRTAQQFSSPDFGNHQGIILAEFVVAELLVAATPIATKDTPGALSPYVGSDMVKMLSIGLLYFLLEITAVFSGKAGRFAAWFGGLILLVVGLNEANNIAKVLGIFSGLGAATTATAQDAGGNVSAATGTAASAAGGVAAAVGNFLGNLFPATGANAANQQGGAAQSGALEPGVQGTVAGGHGR